MRVVVRGCAIDKGLEELLGHIEARQPLAGVVFGRSEEHTSELQSLTNLVCRLLLEKKKQKTI